MAARVPRPAPAPARAPARTALSDVVTTVPPRARKDQRQDARRQGLLDEALRMVREEGGDALTLQALGARMGLSKPALYYYWKSKDELLDAVVLDVLTRETHDVMSAIDQAPDGVAAVAAAARARVHHHARDLHGFRMLHALATRTVAPTTLLAVYGLSARVNGALEKRLKEDRAAGLLDDHVKPRVLANLSWVVAEGVLSVASLMDAAGGNTRHSIDELIEHACETLVRGARLTSHKPAPGKVAKSARKARVTTSTST